jgi:hypothetical protein
MVRALVVFALGHRNETVLRGSSTTQSIFRIPSSMAAARPTGPPPAIRTDVLAGGGTALEVFECRYIGSVPPFWMDHRRVNGTLAGIMMMERDALVNTCTRAAMSGAGNEPLFVSSSILDAGVA